ncbi:hypothetical protein HPP92_006912 [Vanilla planifolia]|uniref:Retrotransposon gag domain-containing protein n=1 Tax=Vanilla planifolia TaxID=51239 RepID=A0A835RJB2_VANPL|nr:hypothetical protein HPP92_006912 [Vanilla planifolia]
MSIRREGKSFFALVLEGEAATWWRGQWRAMFGEAQNSEIAWDDFVEAFRECYIPASAMAQFRRELIHLRQGQMSVNDYLSRFTYLARYAVELVPSEERRCEMFWRDFVLYLCSRRLVVSRFAVFRGLGGGREIR